MDRDHSCPRKIQIHEYLRTAIKTPYCNALFCILYFTQNIPCYALIGIEEISVALQ